MTFEEWFDKEYDPANIQLQQLAEKQEDIKIPADLYIQELKVAFEAGMKTGKDIKVLAKWHDLRKDPNDLPKEGSLVVAIHKNGNIHLYKYLDGWSSANKERVVGAIIIPIIAWCEIPKVEEK